jgi:hypothetical protein
MAKTYIYVLSLSVGIVFLLPGSALPHSGRLDANGCHHDHKRGGYHCHRGPSVEQSPSRIERPGQSSQQAGVPTPEPASSPLRSSSILPEEGDKLALGDQEERRLIGVNPQACEGFFTAYSETEIVDALVKVREAFVTLAGIKEKPEMLGKADARYINAVTVCHDLTLANVSPSQFADELRRMRSKRAEKDRWLGEYRHQMLTIPAVPLERPETGDPQRSAPNEQDLDTGGNTYRTPILLTIASIAVVKYLASL